MPYIPSQVLNTPLSQKLAEYLGQPRQGKVRDTYTLTGGKMLVVATDRISIFDFVLGSLVSGKGEVLTAMTIFWMVKVLTNIQNHLVAFGRDIDDFLPAELRTDLELQKRAVVVHRLKMVPVECVVRGYLTGSGWTSYQKTGEVCGHALPEGLHDGSKLNPIFTPTTKAEEGHDENLDADDVVSLYGQGLCDLSLEIFKTASEYALELGILLADTKFEFGEGGRNDFILADEALTPDSSRFWLHKDWVAAWEQNTSPNGYDKQIVREWGKSVPHKWVPNTGIHRLDNAKSEHQKFVGEVVLPDYVSAPTFGRYANIFRILSGYPLYEFQKSVMGVR